MQNLTQSEDHALCRAQMVVEDMMSDVQDRPDDDYWRGFRQALVAVHRKLGHERIYQKDIDKFWRGLGSLNSAGYLK